MLPRAEKLAGTAKAKVDLGKFEAVACGLERPQSLLRFFGLRRGEDAAEAGMHAAADPPAKLVQFRQPEPLAAFDRPGHANLNSPKAFPFSFSGSL